MSSRGNHSRNPEINPIGIGDEKIGRSTFDDNWKPGDPDLYSDEVRALSDPERPGIARSPQMVDIGGMHITREQALLLGFIEE